MGPPVMTKTFPDAVLAHHTAVLGKTGSGKTSTAKLIVEQAVAEGARVCILDPIKSDWWGSLTPAQQAIIDAIAWCHALGNQAPPRTIVAFLADSSPRSSTFEKYVSVLRTKGLIDFPTGGALALTGLGNQAANRPTAMLTHRDIMEAIARKLTPGQMNILRAAVAHYPHDLSREQLADAAKVSASSSTFEKYVSQLNTLELVAYPAKGRVKASERLFP